MTRFKRRLAVLALAGASIGVWEGGAALFEKAQFAQAEQKVETSREQLQKVEDLSTVFRNVAKVIEPSVVQIKIQKTIKGGGAVGRFMPNDELRRFFQQHGGNMPPQMNPNDQNDNNDENAPEEPAPDLHEEGTGSGVIMEVNGSDAYIITNNHVAGDATDMTITLSDGRLIKHGTLVGADAKSDLAVVKISADHLMAAKWGDSGDLERGDWVLAFGSPFGYGGSMTHGIVSALNRDTSSQGASILGRGGYEHFIQVDAPINPGNSGGPLVNIHGEVIGINTAIATQSGGFQGIGFAIPSNEAKTIVSVLKAKGKFTRGWLGVGIADVSDRVRVPEGELKSLGYTGEDGIFVSLIMRDTPAFGVLRPRDIITSVDGKPVKDTWQLRNLVAATTPGTELKLQVFRDHKTQDVTVKLGEQPDNLDTVASRRMGGAKSTQTQAMGMRLSDVTDESAKANDLGDTREGALVTSVAPSSLAEKAGLQPGDLITQINGENIANASQATEVLGKLDAGKGISINVTNREGSSTRFLQKE
jgi:serine protease Do